MMKNKETKLEKIIICVSKPMFRLKQTQDNMGHVCMDDSEVSGKMIFIANKEKYERWKRWMDQQDQWKNMDEVYIYDRFHISGEDMIERSTMMLHEYSYTITLKEKFKECWWNGEVSGCRLHPEFALDPDNKRW